jgi:hypothetical protein
MCLAKNPKSAELFFTPHETKRLCLAQARDRRPDRVHRVDSCIKKSGKTTLNGATLGMEIHPRGAQVG